jgi:hypothetical protein
MLGFRISSTDGQAMPPLDSASKQTSMRPILKFNVLLISLILLPLGYIYHVYRRYLSPAKVIKQLKCASHHNAQLILRACEKPLQRKTSSKRLRFKLYIYCHNKKSCASAKDISEGISDWTVEIVKLRKSFYFESIVYYDMFAHITDEWDAFDYIITSTYKTILSFDSTNLTSIRSYMSTLEMYDIDVLPLMRHDASYLQYLRAAHGDASIKAFFKVLNSLGYYDFYSHEFDCKRAFYRNIFIVRPKILVKLAKLIRQAIRNVDSQSPLRKALEHDAGYTVSNDSRQVFGSSYYHLHPFVFERLPIFLLHAMGARVCDPSDGAYRCSCPYNFFDKNYNGSILIY